MKSGWLFGKRVFDLAVAGPLVILLIPFFLMITLGYWLQGETKLFFRQQRIGKDGRYFHILKFRTLKTDETLSIAERRFGWGDFLRKSSLDELPQLFNVLKGDMSLVGPRPLPVEYDDLFSKEQHVRHHIRPGITGLAQINGRNSITWSEKFRYDIEYVRTISLWLDIKILWATLLLVFSFRNDISLDEEKFKGQ